MNMELIAGAFGGTSVGGTVVAWLEDDTWREVEAEAVEDEDGIERSEGFSIFRNLSCSDGSSSSSLDESRLTALSVGGTLSLQELMSMVSGEMMDVEESQPAWKSRCKYSVKTREMVVVEDRCCSFFGTQSKQDPSAGHVTLQRQAGLKPEDQASG